MSNATSNKINTQLQEGIFNALRSALPLVPATVLKNVSGNVAEEYSLQLAEDISLGSNKQLNEIPLNAEGPINPVNLTNANNGPNDLFPNLKNIIQDQFSGNYSNNILGSVEGQLKSFLPGDQALNLNFATLLPSLQFAIEGAVKSSIDLALLDSLENTFNYDYDTPSYLNNIEDVFNTTADSDLALEKIDQAFNISIASEALSQLQDFEVDYEENQEKLVVLKQGFTDPNANYPTKEYSGKSETNKLAQGDIKGTVVQDKNDARMTGAKLPYGMSWDQPESPYRGAYPYNKVTQTEQGHIIEIDDTPGSERLHVYHKSGTFIEIDANGSVIKRARGSSYEIIDRNGKVAIAGSADISINGACNIFVGNDANIEVEGDVNLTCHNDITAQAGGTLNMSAKEEVNISSTVVNIEAYHTMNMKGNVALNLHSSNVIHMHSNVDVKVQGVNSYHYFDNVFNQAAEAIYNKAGTSIFTQATTDIHTKAGSSLYSQAGSDVHVKAGSDVNIDSGSDVYINSSTSSSTTDSQNSKRSFIARSSNIGILSGRKDIADNSLPDPQSLTLADSKSILLEEETQSTEQYNQHKNFLISSGYATSQDIDNPPLSLDSESPTSIQSLVIEPDINLKKVIELPGNYNLSPNFTVEMLSNKAAVTRDKIVAHSNLSYGDIIYNLQGIALNILEPVKKLYPNMFVTSAFRDPGNGSNSSTSQHPKGQAVDMQFKGVTKDEYFNLAVKIARVIKYDQLILEYCNYTANPWIHVSFSIEKNRTQVLTFFNHKKHSDGLSNLA